MILLRPILASLIVSAAIVMGALVGCRNPAVVAPSGQRGAGTPSSANIVAPDGYQVAQVAAGLSYPVDVTFDPAGVAYVAEAGGHTYGTMPDEAPPGRIVRVKPDGSTEVVYDKTVPIDEIRKHASSADMPEGLIPPVTGVTYHDGLLYVAHRSRYSTLDPRTGEFHTVINGLPSWGEFLNGKAIFAPDGKMVWFLSTQGNSGVVEAHWIKVINYFNKPDAHEVPGEDVTLAGVNFDSPTFNPKKPPELSKEKTGVYVPLGTATREGQVIKGEKICNGAFFRSDPDGSNIQRIAWGLRSDFGYRYSPDGRLVATQNSANPMKPRGIRFDYETIYEIADGEWYGWPDFYSSIPITDDHFKVVGGPQKFVLTEETHRKLLKGKSAPRAPLAKLPVHSAAEGMVFGRADFGVDPNDVLVAEMGSIVPLYKDAAWPPNMSGKDLPDQKPAGVEMNWPGFRVERVNLSTGKATPFLSNRSGKPASADGGSGLERPIQLEWAPDGSLYVVDFGQIDFSKSGMKAHPKTGKLWRVTRDAGPPANTTLNPTEPK